jgi:hypothetical protein
LQTYTTTKLQIRSSSPINASQSSGDSTVVCIACQNLHEIFIDRRRPIEILKSSESEKPIGGLFRIEVRSDGKTTFEESGNHLFWIRKLIIAGGLKSVSPKIEVLYETVKLTTSGIKQVETYQIVRTSDLLPSDIT